MDVVSRVGIEPTTRRLRERVAAVRHLIPLATVGQCVTAQNSVAARQIDSCSV
jgi:hypothetical protein